MARPKPRGGRALKKRVLSLLNLDEAATVLDEIGRLPARQVINPLISFLYHGNERTRWAAIGAMGAVVKILADEDMEAARLIMRRLMWNLNDESGGIGWGSPEAMGEILANHAGLAEEYVHILLSYTREEGNYLELEMLQRGLLWGIGRLSQVRPALVKGAVEDIASYLYSDDAHVRGLSAWVLGLVGDKECCNKLAGLSQDENEITVFIDERISDCRVKELAQEARLRLECGSQS